MEQGTPVKFVNISQAKYDELAASTEGVESGTIYFAQDSSSNSKHIYLDGECYTVEAPVASDTVSGTVKLNTSQGVSTDSEGKLQVDGILGEKTGGLYHPKAVIPRTIGANSLLITDGQNATVGARTLSVVTGSNLTLATAAPANSTQYQIKNSYENRILAKMAQNGVIALNQSTASTRTVRVTSVTLNGQAVTPSSTGGTSGNIIITAESSVNPDASTTSIRVYPLNDGFSNILAGVAGIPSTSNGYNIIAGQNVYTSANASAVFGNTQYNTGNSSLLAGRHHINTQMDAFLAGQGHDTSSGSRHVTAVGKYSDIQPTTRFAVGGGNSVTDRSNLLAVAANGRVDLASYGGTSLQQVIGMAQYFSAGQRIAIPATRWGTGTTVTVRVTLPGEVSDIPAFELLPGDSNSITVVRDGGMYISSYVGLSSPANSYDVTITATTAITSDCTVRIVGHATSKLHQDGTPSYE